MEQLTNLQREGSIEMAKNVVRGILGILFAAAATWAVNLIVNRIFGPDEGTA
jgi:hypothetical protein